MRSRFYRALFNDNDSDTAIAERVRHRENCEIANAEMMQRFAPLTSGNAQAAIEWQATRISELDDITRSIADNGGGR